MNERSFLSGFRASLIAQLTRIAVNGLIIIMMTRYFFSPQEYGLLFLAVSIFGSALLFSSIGVPKSAARYVTEYKETAPGQVRNVVRTSFKVVLVMSLAVGSIVLLFRNVIAVAFSEPALGPLLAVGLFYIVFQSINTYLTTLFQGFNHITRSAILTICSNVGILCGILLLVRVGLGPIGALTGYVIGYGLGSLVGLGFLYWTLREYEERPIESGLRRRLFEYSIPLMATNGANILYKRVDTLLIGFFLTPIAVGYYTLAKQFSDFIIAPADSFGFTISPAFGEHKANNESHQAARIYEMAFEHTILFYIPAATGLVLVAEPTIQFIFGADYLGAVPVIRVFAAFIVLQAIDKITNDGLDYLGRARQRAIVKTGTGVFNFSLNLFLIPVIGVVGAAISTVLSYSIMVALNVYLIHTELSLALSRLARSAALVGVITVCMAAFVVMLLPFVSSLVTLLAVVFAGGCIWGCLAFASGIPEQNLGAVFS